MDQARVGALAKKAGGPQALFSSRSLKFRKSGLKLESLSPKEMVDLMACEYTFLRRPIIETASGAVSGFSMKAYQQLLGL
jgi:arsenate reductase-like glutaredoxin family protein